MKRLSFPGFAISSASKAGRRWLYILGSACLFTIRIAGTLTQVP